MADPKTISPGEVALDLPLFVVCKSVFLSVIRLKDGTSEHRMTRLKRGT